MKYQLPLIGFITALLAACGGGGDSTSVVDTCSELNSESFDCATSLQAVNSEVVSTIANLETSLITLSTSVDAYCADITDAGLLATAQSDLNTALASVQQLEVMQFGPYADVRDDFYAWPSNSTCRVDEQVAIAADADISSIDSGKRGLTSIEYILNSNDVAMECGSLTNVSNWIAVTNISERRDARCGYAKRIIDDLEMKVASLESDQTAFDFEAAFETLQQGANSISNALFYIDTETKDVKVKAALPQLTTESFDASKLESQYAHISKENIENNLLGAKAVLEAGLDDYLIVKGQESLATEMIQAIDGALANIAEIEGALNDAVLAAGVTAEECINLGSTGSYDTDSSDLEAYCALQWNIKTFTDLLKNDFVLALSFSTPATADGDND